MRARALFILYTFIFVAQSRLVSTHYMFVEEMNVTQQLLCPIYVLVLLGSGELVVDKTDTLNGLIMIIHLKDDETWTLGGSSGHGRKGWICGIL